MKRLFIVIASIISVASFAQNNIKSYLQSKLKEGETYHNGWIAKHVKGDELINLRSDSVFQYITLNGIATYSMNTNIMVIRTTKQIFDVEDRSEIVIVGYYDENHNLKRKGTLDMMFDKDYTCGSLLEGYTIWDYIKKEKGFVRIMTSLYPSGVFELEMQCLKNEKDTNEELPL